MKFGTIGAGTVALAFAREALATSHEVVSFAGVAPALAHLVNAFRGSTKTARTLGPQDLTIRAYRIYSAMVRPAPYLSQKSRSLPA